MIARFVSIEVPLKDPAELQRSILQALQSQGEPLRWAITGIKVDKEQLSDGAHRQIAQIEAVVLSPTQFAIPFTSVTTV